MKKFCINKNKIKGFTLIEMVVVVAVMSILMLASIEIFSNMYTLSLRTNDTRIAQQEARYALDTITQEAREATSLIPTSAGANNSTVNLVNQQGQTVNFSFSCLANCGTVNEYGRIVMDVINVDGTRQPLKYLTNDKVEVTQFYIQPTEIASETSGLNRGGVYYPFFNLRIVVRGKSLDRTGQKPIVTLKTAITRNPYSSLSYCELGLDETRWNLQTANSGGWANSSDFNENIGYIVGDSGSIRKSTDRGKTWISQTSGVTSNLLKVDIVDNSIAYVVGQSNSLRKTINGGTTWSAVGAGPGGNLSEVFFIDANTGFVGNVNGTIYKTTNGGTHWTSLTLGGNPAIWGIDFVDANTGYMVTTNGGIYKTTNGGTSWTAQTSGTTTTFQDVDAVNASIVYAVDSSGNIFKTTNGGTNWSNIYITNKQNSSVKTYETNTVLVSGMDLIFKSNDAGATWSYFRPGGVNVSNSLSLIGPSLAFMVNNIGEVYQSNNIITECLR